MAPICALATPPGRSAIGIIRASGENVFKLLGEAFILPNSSVPNFIEQARTALYGNFRVQEKIIDDVILIPYRAPHSYTGEDSFEIHAHGNPIILNEILSELFRLGFSPARPGEFTKRAFLNGKLSLTQAQAVEQMIEARSLRETFAARKNREGRFQKMLLRLRSDLMNVLADFTAELDFIEEDIQFLSASDKIRLLYALQEITLELLNSAMIAEKVRDGFQIAILGAPNTGKSSLLNFILGHERALVSDEAGTTRDYLEASFELDGILTVILDTAGIREHASGSIEKAGIEKSRRLAKQADLLLVMIDGSLPKEKALRDSPLRSVELFRTKPYLLLVNKADALHESWKVKDSSLFEKANLINKSPLYVSVLNGSGMDTLHEQLRKAASASVGKEDAILMSEWQQEILRGIYEQIRETEVLVRQDSSPEIPVASLHAALDKLGELTGEITNDEILGRIFSRFCIGK